MINMRNVEIWNIHVRLMENEAMGYSHFDDLLTHIDETISRALKYRTVLIKTKLKSLPG